MVLRSPTAQLLLILSFGALAACSVPETPTEIHDPYEPVNRSFHAFNKGLDRVAIRPLSIGYGTVVPAPVRQSVDNVASNLGMPSVILNRALQGDTEETIKGGFRFVLNSTIGVFGLFDVAEDFSLPRNDTDFGQTLAIWGAEEGAYLELPFLGPSTERDAVGQVVDIVTNPLGFATDSADVTLARVSSRAGSIGNARYNLRVTIDGILYDSADSYAQLRLFYLESSRFNQSDGDISAVETEIYDDLYGDIFDE